MYVSAYDVVKRRSSALRQGQERDNVPGDAPAADWPSSLRLVK